MRHSIFTFVLFFLWIQFSFSQISFGVQGGINLATQEFSSELKEVSGEVSLNQYYFIGASIKTKESEKISLILNAQYSQKGYKVSNQFGESEFRASYVDLLPEIEFWLNQHFAISIGPYTGLLIKEEFSVDRGKFKAPVVELAKNVDFGAHAALKFYINKFYILGRYEYGIAKAIELDFTDSNGVLLGKSNQRNRVIQIGLGYYFG